MTHNWTAKVLSDRVRATGGSSPIRRALTEFEVSLGFSLVA